MYPLIDYSMLADAMKFYASRQYIPVEVPWVVSRDACYATLPETIEADCFRDGYLIGSAEQGFVEMGAPSRKLVACSPCFRNEPVIDDLHQSTFMKVELYRGDITTDEALEEMIDDAFIFMSRYRDDIRIVSGDPPRSATEQCFDIETTSGIEIGSYGRRRHASQCWLYGTGLALPRFTALRSGRQLPRSG